MSDDRSRTGSGPDRVRKARKETGEDGVEGPEQETWEAVPVPAETPRDEEETSGAAPVSEIPVVNAELVAPPDVPEDGPPGRPATKRKRQAGKGGEALVNRGGIAKMKGGKGRVNHRGISNGSGLVNGNGMVTGRHKGQGGRRGLVNGRGLSNGNGLINGGSHGMANGHGLTNGNGMTNGNGVVMDEPAPGPRRRSGWMAAGVVIILLTVAVLSYYLLVTNEKGIRVDGSFSDWSGMGKYSAAGPAVSNPDIEIQQTALAVDGSSASFYVKTSGQTLEGRNDGVDSAYFFIDTDQDASSGYAIHSVGAEYVLIVDGYNGHVKAAGLYKFTREAGRPSNDWNAKTATGSARAAAAGSELESQVQLSDIGSGAGKKLCVVACMRDSFGNESFGAVMGNEVAALEVRWSQTGPASAAPGSSGVQMVRFELSSIHGAPSVSSLRLWVNEGTTPADIGKLTLLTASGSELPATVGTVNGGSILFSLRSPLKVTGDEAVALTVQLSVPSDARSGRAMGLYLSSPSDIGANTRAVTLVGGAWHLTYIGAAADNIVIDGAFSDWSTIPPHPDPKGDVADPNIDLSDFRVTNDTGSLYLLAQVDGTMMGGAGIPEGKVRPSGTGGGGGGQVQLPVLAGQDSFYVLVDTDGRPDTGYSGGGVPLGADFMVLVTGQYGRVLERQVHSFTGGTDRTKWSWSSGTDIAAATDLSRMELQVPLGALGDPKGNVSLFYYTTDWKALRDAGDRLSYDLRAPGGGRSLPPGYMPPAGGLPFGDDHSKDLGVPEFRDAVVPLACMTALFLAFRRKRDPGPGSR